MSVRVEKNGAVWTVIHSRPEARNAMDPESAKALFDAFQSFEADVAASVAVFWGEGGAFCAGWDLKHAASLAGAEALEPFDFPDEGEPPIAAMGPSRLELSKPVIAAVAERPSLADDTRTWNLYCQPGLSVPPGTSAKLSELPCICLSEQPAAGVDALVSCPLRHTHW